MESTETAGTALFNEEVFEELLNSIENATISERDKGTRFETLTRDWLMREPTYNDLFTQVQTYKDWAAEHPHLASNRKDIGIDLVGTNLADGKLTAVQCKFYLKSHTVSKTEVDSFIAFSDRDYFTGRLIVVTSEKISGNLEEELRHLKVPATIITRGTMGRSMIDWSAYMRHEQKTLEKRELRTYQKQAIKHATKVIGCWKALSKKDVQNETIIVDDSYPMKRAVGFAQVSHPRENYDRVSSMQFAEHFQDTVKSFKDQYLAIRMKLPDFDEMAFDLSYDYTCDCRHIDGSMSVIEKDAMISWLKEEPENRHCKILFNVRCLSEGVDVSAFDAVIFLSPRKSQVDAVQTVGRVMCLAPGKVRGYVIIPIVMPDNTDFGNILDNNRDFKTIGQVLRALKSIAENFVSIVDGQLEKIDTNRLETGGKKGNGGRRKKKKETGDGNGGYAIDLNVFEHNEILDESIKAVIVKNIGNRMEWGDRAEYVGEICREQIKQIRAIIDNPRNRDPAEKYTRFKEEFRAILSSNHH